MTVRLILPWPPSVNHYWARKGKIVFLTKDAKAYRVNVYAQVLRAGPGFKVNGRLAVHIVATPPDRRIRDLDNLHKACLDSLKVAGVFHDDEQIDDLRITRRLPPIKGGMLDVTITEIDGAGMELFSTNRKEP